MIKNWGDHFPFNYYWFKTTTIFAQSFRSRNTKDDQDKNGRTEIARNDIHYSEGSSLKCPIWICEKERRIEEGKQISWTIGIGETENNYPIRQRLKGLTRTQLSGMMKMTRKESNLRTWQKQEHDRTTIDPSRMDCMMQTIANGRKWKGRYRLLKIIATRTTKDKRPGPNQIPSIHNSQNRHIQLTSCKSAKMANCCRMGLNDLRWRMRV
jgi:hypothetical protein